MQGLPAHKMETVGSYRAASCRNSISILHRAYPSSTSSNVPISSSVLTDSSPVRSAHTAISTLTNLCGLGRSSTVAVILLPLRYPKFGSFQPVFDGHTFHTPIVASTWTTVGVWFAQMPHYQDNLGGGWNWESSGRI